LGAAARLKTAENGRRRCRMSAYSKKKAPTPLEVALREWWIDHRA
jgi:hypothetical protein